MGSNSEGVLCSSPVCLDDDVEDLGVHFETHEIVESSFDSPHMVPIASSLSGGGPIIVLMLSALSMHFLIDFPHVFFFVSFVLYLHRFLEILVQAHPSDFVHRQCHVV